MNIENYRLFLRAAKTGSLTAAAEQSGYTQSAVSHVIAGLEKEFGFPLFTRSKTGVTLTQDGERMLIHIREVVNRDDLAHQVANEIKGLRSGRVRIGAFSSAAICFLPDLIPVNPFVRVFHLAEADGSRPGHRPGNRSVHRFRRHRRPVQRAHGQFKRIRRFRNRP